MTGPAATQPGPGQLGRLATGPSRLPSRRTRRARRRAVAKILKICRLSKLLTKTIVLIIVGEFGRGRARGRTVAVMVFSFPMILLHSTEDS